LITSRKCIHISQNLFQHSKRSLRHIIILLQSYDLFFSIICAYTHILAFIFQLVCAMGEARAQDTNILCYKIPKFIPLNYKTDSVMPPITGGEKSGRGFSHPATGKFLCPLRYFNHFQNDPM
jgi:hypothetical protein